MEWRTMPHKRSCATLPVERLASGLGLHSDQFVPWASGVLPLPIARLAEMLVDGLHSDQFVPWVEWCHSSIWHGMPPMLPAHGPVPPAHGIVTMCARST